MTIIPERLALLDTMHLDKGSHRAFEDGHCAMEVAAWLAGEEHTDAPVCVSPVLRSFLISANDSGGDAWAASDALAPTVSILQDSALELLDRMIDPR